MPITLDDFRNGTAVIHHHGAPAELATFATELAASFLKAGEAKWWDAQLLVAMTEVISGIDPVVYNDQGPGVCRTWTHTQGFKVSLKWRSTANETHKNPYGSVTELAAPGPATSFCRGGNVA